MDPIMESLQAPFPSSDIEWRVGSTNKEKTQGLALAYVTNRAIQNRLDEVFGPFGWKNEFKEWKGQSQLCGISVKHEGEWITKWDGADNSNMEAVKGGLSDSMKRAAYQWGIGRYLYKLPATWAPLKNGKYLAKTPELPEWALPNGEKKPEGEPVEPITSKQIGEIKIKVKELAKERNADEKIIYNHAGIGDLTKITADEAEQFKARLDSWIENAIREKKQGA
jgi:hypothetical protein